MKNRIISIVGTVMVFCALSQTTMGQFFTNDLTDAASVLTQFTTNCGPEGVWSFTNDYALAQNGSANTVLQGGAVVGMVTTNDIDAARSYLATVNSNYLGKSWVAHIGVETVNVDPKNYIFFGLGAGRPNSGDYYEPTAGQGIHVQWQSGNSKSKVSVIRNNATVQNTGAWQGDPGYDIYMTYNHLNKTIKFEIDNWSGGRFSDIDVTTLEHSVDGYLTDTNDAHIYFGGNAVMTFRDFDVVEIDAEVPPATPTSVYTVISNMAVQVKWNVAGGASAYNVKRMTDGESEYVTIASGVTNLSYVDTTVETNVIYHYVVAATNQFGLSADSAAATGKGFPYSIIGTSSSYGAGSALDMDNLFDGDINVFADTTTAGSWAGVDLGYPQEVQQIKYVMRSWSFAVSYGSNATFEACNDPTFPTNDIVVLGTIPADVATHPTINTLSVTNTEPFRYVRVKGRTANPDARPLYFLAEMEVLTSENIVLTDKGTPVSWLLGYGLTAGDDELDTDGDGHEAWKEYLAGTNPTNAASVLKVTSIGSAGSDYVITWQSVAGRNYSVITNLNLVYPSSGVAASNIHGLAGETSYTTTVSGASSLFYKIGVE